MMLTSLSVHNNLALNDVEGVIDSRCDCDCVAMEDGSPEQNRREQLYGFTITESSAYL